MMTSSSDPGGELSTDAELPPQGETHPVSATSTEPTTHAVDEPDHDDGSQRETGSARTTFVEKVRDFLGGGERPQAGDDDDRADDGSSEHRSSESTTGAVGYRRAPDGTWQTAQSTSETTEHESPVAQQGPVQPEKSSESGSFASVVIGEPGRAFTTTVSRPPTDARFCHDIALDSVTISDADERPRLALRGASSRGLMHQHYADPRQDDHGYALSENGEYVVLTVSDGVSSGTWSHHAATIAAEEGAAHVAQLLAVCEPDDVQWHDVLSELSDRIVRRCAELRGAVDQGLDLHSAVPAEAVLDVSEVARLMAATLVVAIVRVLPDDTGAHALTVCQYGDSGAWILDPTDGWTALGAVKNEGNVIAESATACLPYLPKGEITPASGSVGSGQTLLLLSDGVGDPLGSGRGEVGERLGQLWSQPPHVLEFAAQIAFGRKTYDDDRGAVAVWPMN